MCRDWTISIRRACGALDFDRSTYHYTSRRADQAGLERRIREICETRVRYGYRRVHVLLVREGWGTNIKRTYRIYRDLGLQLRNKTPKRRVKAKLREDRQMAVGPNDVWAMDFVHDQLATGKKLRVLTVVDTFSRYVPVLDPRHSYRGEDVVQTLERVCCQVGYPKTIRVDQGTEFVSRSRSLGLCQGCDPGLLTAGKTDRQCLHRSVQRPLPGGLPEPTLVPDPCGRPRKDGGLAQRLQ